MLLPKVSTQRWRTGDQFTYRRLALAAAAMAAALVLAACRPSSAAPQLFPSRIKTPINAAVQLNQGGAVTVKAKWMGSDGGMLIFDIEMATHSLDLDEYDLGNLSVLINSAGEEYPASIWRRAPATTSSMKGHHVEGTLSFRMPDSVARGRSDYVQLVIRGMAGIPERVFKWQF